MTARTAETDSSPALWRDRDFAVFWSAQTLSVVGDGFASVAVPLLVLQVTGSVALMGLLTAVAGVAAVATAVFAGVLADRADRRRLLIGCDLARAVLFAAVPVAWLWGPQLWLLYVVLPASAAVGMVFRVAYVAAVPGLVDVRRITEANGKLSASYAIAGIGGPLLAGVVAASFGYATAVAVNAASFTVSALALCAVRLRQVRVERTAPTLAGLRRELLDGALFLWHHPVLRSLTVLLSVFLFLTYGLDDVLIYHVGHNLGGSDRTVGLVLGLAAGGTVVGSLVVAPLRRRIGFGATWSGSMAVAGVAVAAVGSVRTVPAVTALAAAYLGGLAVGAICSLSLRQEVTPNHLLGRVTSVFWATHYALGPLGAAVVTWGAEAYGVPVVCAVAGGGCVLVALAALATPVVRTRPG
ncbi:MFS transporter [Micromonospora craterilacus]|uniref:MFS transporter n=1 Tax=Micromonospora craterilacus TaxID=1655439 RepID=A0A2W2DFX2_9ACTN|nr:MFS transporter [Micromonospora craterilacus]PZG10772.1 MFS transporter [Micromonospora craterilacus]